ncbi:hypothetical protein HOD20_01575 [archaeon]|jgi:hypothetical protein|nr:hypothetical protein [archaeon]MBT4646788.1 hypothetical protein [archaeon]MBT6821464.1 hypothetical protein [archaeon]
MLFLKSFKPNKKKIIIFIIVALISYVFLSSIKYRCATCPMEQFKCTDFRFLSPIATCICGCTSLLIVLRNWVIVLIPGFIVYFLISLYEFFREL